MTEVDPAASLLDVLTRLQAATRAFRISSTADSLDAGYAVDEVANELGELLCPLDGRPDVDLTTLHALAAAQRRATALEAALSHYANIRHYDVSGRVWSGDPSEDAPHDIDMGDIARAALAGGV